MAGRRNSNPLKLNHAFRTLQLVSLPLLAASSCSSHTDCGPCVNSTTLGGHTCEWCEMDAQCHAVGSLESPCYPSGKAPWCISESSLSSCGKTSVAFCSGAMDDSRRAQQIHLAFAGATGMRVSFKTWLQPNESTVVVTEVGSSNTMQFSLDSSVNYIEDGGYHHTATLKGLGEGKSYDYYIETDGIKTTTRHFKMADANQMEASVLVVGDWGYGEQGHAIASRQRIEALKSSTDFMLIAGDIGYADDSFDHASKCMLEFCYETVYDAYMQWIENYTDAKPFMVAVGNHESECHSPACITRHAERAALRNFTAYNARFAMPAPESGGVMNMWYSFDYGPIHFVVINTETDFPHAPEFDYGDAGSVLGMPAGHFAPEGEYLRWLEADLAKANENRERRPWVVTVGHRPWRLAPKGKKTEAAVEEAHSKLFEKYGVDMFVAGHQHNYQRLLPLGNNTGVPFVISGGAGCDEWLGNQESSGKVDSQGQTDEWDWRYWTMDTQVGTLEATATELTFKAIASKTGEVFDTVTLKKEAVVTV